MTTSPVSNYDRLITAYRAFSRMVPVPPVMLYWILYVKVPDAAGSLVIILALMALSLVLRSVLKKRAQPAIDVLVEGFWKLVESLRPVYGAFADLARAFQHAKMERQLRYGYIYEKESSC